MPMDIVIGYVITHPSSHSKQKDMERIQNFCGLFFLILVLLLTKMPENVITAHNVLWDVIAIHALTSMNI